MTYAVGYGRMSSKRSDGESLIAQKQAFEAWCTEQGHTNAGWFKDDGVSGGTVKRPDFDAALARCAEVGGAVLYARDMARIGRTVKLLAVLTEATDNGHVLGYFPGGREITAEMMGMELVFAQRYLTDTKKLQKARSDRDRAEGYLHVGGTRAYGYEVIQKGDKVRRPIAAEQARICDAVEAVLAGRSLTSIVTDWNAQGLTSSNGNPWQYQSLRTMLVRPYLSEVVGQDKAETVRDVLTRRGKKWKGTRRAFTRWLNGVLVCGRCGVLLDSHSANGRAAYACTRVGGCGGSWVTAGVVEALVEQFMVDRVAVSGGKSDEGYSSLVKERADNTAKIARLTDLQVDGDIDLEEYRERKAKLAAEVERIDQSLLAMGTHAALAGSIEKWHTLDAAQKRDGVLYYCGQLTVLPGDGSRNAKGQMVFRPGRIKPERPEVARWWRSFTRGT